MNNDGFVVRIVIGFFLVLLGLSIFLDQIGINLFGFNVFNLWPLILIVLGVWMLLKRKLFPAVFLLALGVAFLASTIFGFSVFQIMWPLIIIFIGVSILFKPHKNWGNHGDASFLNKDRLDESIVFWGLDADVKSDNFVGGKVECVFGGFKIDLRDTKISNDGARLEISCVFGGGEIVVPQDVRVELESDGFMGGVSNKARASNNSSDPVLRIKASAVFGGVEIKN